MTKTTANHITLKKQSKKKSKMYCILKYKGSLQTICRKNLNNVCKTKSH